MIVGAHALAAYVEPRATGDLDIWIRATPENAERVWKALVEFGAPLHELTKEDLLSSDLIFQMGVIPARIDILTSITGVEFEEAWQQRQHLNIENRQVPVLHRDHLISNKIATGRPKDLGDVAALQAPVKKRKPKAH